MTTADPSKTVEGALSGALGMRVVALDPRRRGDFHNIHFRAASRTGTAAFVKVLRHTTAMTLKRAGVDISMIALWLGHEDIDSTPIYIHVDLELKERALARTTRSDIPPGGYKAPDQLLAYLESL